MSLDVSYQYRHYVKPYLRDPKKKAYTLLGMTLVATIVFGAFAIRPALATVISLRKEVKDLRGTDELLNQKIASLSTAQSHYKSNKENLYLFDVALPNEAEIPEIINTLNTVAGKSGVSWTNFSLEENSEKNSGLRTNKINIQISGKYKNVTVFLRLLENNLRQIKIRNIQVTKHGDDPEGVLDVFVSLEFYYLAE